MQSPSYQSLLREELAHRQSRNAGYSFRAFARDLGIAVSTLSEVLGGVKGISAARARKLAKRLGLTADLRELFVLSARAQHARSAVEREAAAASLAELTRAAPKAPPNTLAIVSWVVEAVLKISERRGVVLDVDQVAASLGAPADVVRFARRFLTRLGFLEGTPKSRAFLAFLGAGRRINVDNRQLLRRAIEANERPSPSDRFWREPLLLDARGLAKATALVERCFEDIKRLEDNGPKSDLFYVTTQLFQVSDIEHHGES
ncbi:MAG: hypothetical protein ACE37F_09260 [Nannocystaceae bacterium]|nr:helix-turn-helix domain-containing protein [bacterium]